MHDEQIEAAWRTPLGAGIPELERSELSNDISNAYDRYPDDALARAHLITDTAWQRGHSIGGPKGVAQAAQLITQMIQHRSRLKNPTAQLLGSQARSLQHDVAEGDLAWQLNSTPAPRGLAVDLHWLRGGQGPRDAVQMASFAWWMGHEAGAATGGLLAHDTIARAVDQRAQIDGLPVDGWLDLAFTPVHERWARNHRGADANRGTIAAIPTRLVMSAGVNTARAIVDEARRLYPSDDPRLRRPDQGTALTRTEIREIREIAAAAAPEAGAGIRFHREPSNAAPPPRLDQRQGNRDLGR